MGRKNVTIRLTGDTFESYNKEALAFTKKNNMIFVHPFDDPLIIAGQGTVGFEILSECKHHI